MNHVMYSTWRRFARGCSTAAASSSSSPDTGAKPKEADVAVLCGKLRALGKVDAPDKKRLQSASRVLEGLPRRLSQLDETKLIEATLAFFATVDGQLSRVPAAALLADVRARGRVEVTNLMRESMLLLSATPEGAMVWYKRITKASPGRKVSHHARRALLLAVAKLHDAPAADLIFSTFPDKAKLANAVRYAHLFTPDSSLAEVRDFWAWLMQAVGAYPEHDPSKTALILARTLQRQHALHGREGSVALLRSIAGDLRQLEQRLSLNPCAATVFNLLADLDATAGVPQPPAQGAAKDA